MTQTASRGSSTSRGGTTDAVLMIGWGTPVQGREQKAPQVLSEALSYFKQLEDRGDIDSFDAVALEPHGEKMSGFVLLHGSKDSISRLRTSAELLRIENRAQMVTQSVDVIGGYEGPAFDQILNGWTQAAGELGGQTGAGLTSQRS